MTAATTRLAVEDWTTFRDSLRARYLLVEAFVRAAEPALDAAGRGVAALLSDEGGLILARCGSGDALGLAAEAGCVAGARVRPVPTCRRGFHVAWAPVPGEPRHTGHLGLVSPRESAQLAPLARALAELVAHRRRELERAGHEAEQHAALDRLSAFHDAAMRIGGPQSRDELHRQVADLVATLVRADRAGILFRDPPIPGAAVPGDDAVLRGLPPVERVFATGRVARVADDDDRPEVRAALGRLGAAALALAPVFFGGRTCGAVLFAARSAGAPAAAGRAFSERDLEVLAFVSQQVGLSIENASLREGLERRLEALTREMELARRMQQALLPQKPLDLPGGRVTGATLPSKLVGGDYFDFFRLGGDGCVVAVGDIMGKGVAAALLASLLRAHVRTAVVEHGFGPGVLAAVEGAMWDDLARTGSLATLQVVSFHGSTGRLEALSAGHLPPLCYRKGRWERLPVGGGVSLGLKRPGDAAREPYATVLAPGDAVVLYSDGLADLAAGRCRGAGLARLEAVLAGSDALGEALRRADLAAVRRLVGGHPAGDDPPDDITVVSIQR